MTPRPQPSEGERALAQMARRAQRAKKHQEMLRTSGPARGAAGYFPYLGHRTVAELDAERRA